MTKGVGLRRRASSNYSKMCLCRGATIGNRGLLFGVGLACARRANGFTGEDSRDYIHVQYEKVQYVGIATCDRLPYLLVQSACESVAGPMKLLQNSIYLACLSSNLFLC